MSVSSLPEWKQLLLEKKRREEEERERREKEEEEKLASMPAWKRGIIQRRKAKQDSVGDRDKERDVCFLQVDFRPASDGLSDTDSSMTANLCSEPSLGPDPGLWLDADPKSESQVSVETIVPLHENPFIRTQSAWRKGRDADVGSEPEIKEKEKLNPRGQDGEPGRGRHLELKRERFRDLSEGREKERSRDRSQGRERDNSRERWDKDKSQWKESAKDATREREFLKVRKDEEEKETDPPSGSVSPHVPCLRTIRADNIIIIEQDRKGSDDRKGIWREMERERPEEDHQVKRGMKMDLREILAGGGSVTEIRASEVLIIQPSANPEERNTGGKGREDGEMKCSLDMQRESRELRTDISWLREKEKDRPWGQATVIKEGLKDSSDDNVFLERGGRVSQLLSKFGELPKPPSRSKSSDNFLRPGRRKYSDEDDQQSEERRADGRNMLLKGVPKRSFSFSDRVVCAKENGLGGESCYERKARERTHSDKSVAPWLEVATAKIKMGCALLLDKDKSAKHRDGYGKTNEKGGPPQKRSDAETCVSIQHRSEAKKVEHHDKRAAEKLVDGSGDEGFTAVSVKNTEGISFARRIPIRQDGKTRAEREAKRSLEREPSVEKDPEEGAQTEAQVGDEKKASEFLRADGFQSAVPLETLQSYVMAPSADAASPRLTAASHYRHESAFTECSSLLCTVTDKARDPHRGPEWSGAGPQGAYQAHSVLSQQTEDLLSKIEKIGDTTVYSSERGDRAHKGSPEPPKECTKEGQHYDVGSESLIRDATPGSPKRVAPPGPVEIQIPRTVFYVAEDVAERKKVAGQNNEERDWEGGQGVERRDSWRIGKPLSRIESLREKIRQKELERLRQRETRDGEGSEAAEVSETQAAGERYDERGSEIEPEWEAAAHMRKKVVEADTVQEDAAAQTSMAAFDVTQEVMKTYPQLPVSVPHSQADRGEEVTSGYATAAAEVISDRAQLSDEEDDPPEHEEEQLRCDKARRQSREEEREVEEKALSEEEAEANTSPLDPKQSLSPSPPHPNSLAAMSRIYNLESVRSRSGLCLRERTVDIPSVQLVKVKPHISNAQQGDSKALAGEDICAVQKIQRQIEQFQLKEQEALKSSTSPSTSLKDRETKRQQSPRGGSKHQVKDDFQTREKDQSESNYKASPLRVCSPTSQLKQAITVNHTFLRTQSPDNSLRPSDCAPTPAPSPSSPSPTQSPSVSPSPSPSPTLFSIRSASGGKVKRGATITINPKRNNAAGERGGGGGTGSAAGSTTSAESTPAKTPMQQAQVSPAVAEPMKKKYPTVEEIQVIGGYQNLEKSCLVKNRGTTKRVKVCFDEDQLEQVCEYPSEMSMLACVPHPHDAGRLERQPGEEAQEEEADVDGGAITFKSTRNAGTATGQGLRVDESCPR